MKRAVATGVLILLLGGCGPAGSPPIISKEPHRVIPALAVVESGDSVYTVAWRHGLDFQNIAKWNALVKPNYPLQVGQRLRLYAPGGAPATPTPTTPKPAAKRKSKPATPAKPKPKPAAKPTADPSTWNWPAKGKIIAKFSRNAAIKINGIKIAGEPGSKIRAAAAGQVVYAGEALRGYGKLIIVKHSPTYFSAYGHNRKILVAEHQRIRAGAVIAQMGKTGADRTMLHFEIRKNGKPVDPLRYLK